DPLDEGQTYGRLGRGIDARQNLDADLAGGSPGDGCDPRQVFMPPTVKNRYAVADSEPQDPCQVLRFVSGEGNGLVPRVERWGEEAMHVRGLSDKQADRRVPGLQRAGSSGRSGKNAHDRGLGRSGKTRGSASRVSGAGRRGPRERMSRGLGRSPNKT